MSTATGLPGTALGGITAAAPRGPGMLNSDMGHADFSSIPPLAAANSPIAQPRSFISPAGTLHYVNALLTHQLEMSVMFDCQRVHGWYKARMSCTSISACMGVTCSSPHEQLGFHALVLATC